MAAAIGPPEARQAIEGIAARADANGPRGSFVSEIVSLATGEVRFRLERPDSSTEFLLAKRTPYSRSSAAEPFAPADAALVSFIRGHEIHRILLDLEKRFHPASRVAASGCIALVDEWSSTSTLCLDSATGLPATLEIALPEGAGGGNVTIEFADWRPLHGVRLPFAVDFVHAGERHTYRYNELLPFQLAPGMTLSRAPEALFARLGDLALLATAHERTMEAHRQSDVRLLLDDEAAESLVSGRGSLRASGRRELSDRLGPYLAGIRFDRYEDVAVPAIAISGDGSLGWLGCQIEAEGTQKNSSSESGSERVAYGFSWVELYAREGERWQRVGNASSARQ